MTLDNFGFPVGGRLGARRAVFWPRLPKVALFGPKNAVFGPKSKMARKSDFYAFHCIAWHRMVLHGIALYLMVSHSFHVIPLNHMVLHGIVLYLTVLHGIAMLASARGLYLARDLSTL